MKKLKATKEEIIQAALDGLTVTDIAKKFGYSNKWIRQILIANNIDYIKKKTKNNPSEFVHRYAKEYEYVSGYTTCENKMIIKHINCGYEFEINGITLKVHKDSLHCPRCRQLRLEAQKAIAAAKRVAEKERIKQERNKSKELLLVNGKRITKKRVIVQKEMFFNSCLFCGCLFPAVKSNIKFCSEECRTKSINRKHDKRIERKRIIDSDITLEKLFKRDSGICYLCLGLCDFNDYEQTEKAFIAGGNYPSIEHVKPIAKGGLHSWDNVRLAHRKCNSIKHTRNVDEVLSDFESFRNEKTG